MMEVQALCKLQCIVELRTVIHPFPPLPSRPSPRSSHERKQGCGWSTVSQPESSVEKANCRGGGGEDCKVREIVEGFCSFSRGGI